MDKYEESIIRAVERNQKKLIQITKDLIRFPSECGQEEAAQAYYAGLLESIGVKPDVWEPDIGELEKEKALMAAFPCCLSENAP